MKKYGLIPIVLIFGVILFGSFSAGITAFCGLTANQARFITERTPERGRIFEKQTFEKITMQAELGFTQLTVNESCKRYEFLKKLGYKLMNDGCLKNGSECFCDIRWDK